MAEENSTITAPAPEGVQTPESVKTGLGPVSTKSKFGDKFRAELAKLETTDAPVKETPPPVQTPDQPDDATSTTTPETTKTEQVVEPKEDKGDVKTAKPESPLDVVLEKAEEKPAEEPDILEGFPEKTPNWQKARGVMKTQSEKIKELEAKLTAPKPAEDPVWQKKAEELEKALEEREVTIKSLNAEYSQDYQKLVGKYQGTAEKIKTRMQSFGADGDSLLAALSLPYGKVRTEQVDAALAELPAGKQGRIESLIEELETHGEDITEFRKDLPKKYDEMVAYHQKQAAEQQANGIKQLETEFGKISQSIPAKVVTMREVPEDVPGGTEWNKEIREAREVALRVLKPDGSNFEESTQIALQGARYPTLEKRYLALHKDYSELKKRMAEYDSSGPDFKGGSKPKSTTPKSAPQKYREAMEAIGRGQLSDV